MVDGKSEQGSSGVFGHRSNPRKSIRSSVLKTRCILDVEVIAINLTNHF